MNKLCFTFLTLALGVPSLANASEQAPASDSPTAKTTVAASGSVTASASASATIKVSDQDALGDDIDELFDILVPWGEAIRAGRGYLRAGPHDLA